MSTSQDTKNKFRVLVFTVASSVLVVGAWIVFVNPFANMAPADGEGFFREFTTRASQNIDGNIEQFQESFAGFEQILAVNALLAEDIRYEGDYDYWQHGPS